MKTKTTPEESIELIEAGIDPRLAKDLYCPLREETAKYKDWMIPAGCVPIFTLPDILSLLPNVIGGGYHLNIDATDKGYDVSYVMWDYDNKRAALIGDRLPHAIFAEELTDALHKLLLWVVGQGYNKKYTQYKTK